jgi:hypothetical protein
MFKLSYKNKKQIYGELISDEFNWLLFFDVEK